MATNFRVLSTCLGTSCRRPTKAAEGSSGMAFLAETLVLLRRSGWESAGTSLYFIPSTLWSLCSEEGAGLISPEIIPPER